jgi:dsDNA-specific endonuclease/ATPase MutS2
MFDLDYSQQEAVGITFILNQLEPNGPYGAERKKQIAPFARGEKAALLECFDNIEKIAELSISDKAGLDELCFHLMALKQVRGIVHKCENHTLNQVELFEVKQFLLTFEKLEIVFRRLHKQARFAAIDLQPLDDLLNILDPEGKRIAAFVVQSPELSEIRREKLHVEALLQKGQSQSSESVLTTQRYNLVKREAEEETRVMSELTERLRPFLSVFIANLDNIGKLDLSIAKAMLSLKYGAIRPKLSERAEVLLQNMHNPFVADALLKNNQTMTRVTMTLPKGTTIITGANMGGKSVSVKTAVLNIMLCQMGFFVFAEAAEIPLFDGICLISEDMQNVGRGLSSFGAEITRFNEIAGRLKKEFLFIALDEFARGTNPEEGACIVRAIASFLSESGSVCVMTTHYDKVVSPEFKHYQVAGLDFSKTPPEAGHKLPEVAAYMDYNLIEAGTTAAPPRDALNICKLIGLDQDILDRIGAEYERK